jgi:hypothetical protein
VHAVSRRERLYLSCRLEATETRTVISSILQPLYLNARKSRLGYRPGKTLLSSGATLETLSELIMTSRAREFVALSV